MSGDDDLGLLFEPGDVETLAAQLERLIRDDGLRTTLHERAQAPRGRRSTGPRVAKSFEAIYEEVAARRHVAPDLPAVRARLAERKLIDVDLHMHTDHSSDCATPVEVLLATARDTGLGAIAVTDHNEISGALDARAKAAEFGVKVIVAEEVKTADQGEVIGLFIEEKIPRGMTLDETIAAIRAQGGLVYVPHPFDRLHSVPDYEHLLAVVEDVDAIEIFNPRIAISAFNEEAVRFAAKYRIVGGAGSDAHVPQGLGSVRITMRDFDGPEEFLESLRDADIVRKPQLAVLRPGPQVPADEGHAAGRAQGRAAAPRPPGRTQPMMQAQGEGGAAANPLGGMPATDDEIREKYLERAIRELNHFTRDLQACSACPRGNLMPVLGSGHPQADVFLLKYAPAPSEIEEGVAFYGRSGTALMKSLRRLDIDPLAVYGTLCVKCPVADTSLAAPECLARLVEEIAIVQPKIVVVMGDDALETLNELALPLARTVEDQPGVVQVLTPSIDALVVPDIDDALDEEDAKRAFWTAFRSLGDWWAQFPPY